MDTLVFKAKVYGKERSLIGSGAFKNLHCIDLGGDDYWVEDGEIGRVMNGQQDSLTVAFREGRYVQRHDATMVDVVTDSEVLEALVLGFQSLPFV